MKINFIITLSALSLCFASCYEINDLEQDYKDQYKSAKFTEFHSQTNWTDQITFMRLSFDIENYKNDCSLLVHYTDVKGADPFTTGMTVDISSMLDDPYQKMYNGYTYELHDLTPESEYWAGLSYSDPGCNTIRTKVVNFVTEGFDRRSDCYDYGSDYMVVSAKFRRIPDGSAFGCLIGTDEDLTLDHCLESREMGRKMIGDNEEVFTERFNGLQPETTYYYRAYVIYRDRIYYSSSWYCYLHNW